MGEGALLGYGQARTLRDWLPGIARGWTGATAVAAGFAWACGMAPSTLADLGAPAWAPVAAISVLGLPLLFSIGVAQAAVLRGRVERPWRWSWMNAVAWVAGLPPTFIAPSLLPADAAPWMFALAFAAGGLAMATIVAFATGWAMSRLLGEGNAAGGTRELPGGHPGGRRVAAR